MSPTVLEPSGTPARLSARTYLALGLLGLVALGLGIWAPALAGLPDAAYLDVAFAVAGGVLSVWGLVRWNALRTPAAPPAAQRDVRLEIPSLEVYSPPPRSSGRPTKGRQRPVLALFAVLLAIAVCASSMPGVSAASAAAGGPSGGAPPSPSPIPPDVASSHVAPASVAPASPIPVCNPPLYPPAYAPINGLFPPLPLYTQQSPCKTAHDEVHLSFGSSAPGSGQQWGIPVYLPRGGPSGQGAAYGDFYLGMVVSGDPTSVDQQSYAELVFLPQGTGVAFHWSIDVAVWSLLLDTNCTAPGGAAAGLNLSYQNSYACVADQVNPPNGGVLQSSVAPGSWGNVTFVGSAGNASRPLSVYFNDTTNPNGSASFRFTSAATHSYAFYPEYGTACPTNCVLNWSTPFGLGEGVDLCETSSCFSYNATLQASEPPFTTGAPHFWTGLNYSGDYRYLGPSSSSGACSGVTTVVPCDANAQAGAYPFFSLNGTEVNFGTDYAWTTEDFGGASREFNAYGTMNQFTPLFLDRVSNSSLAGYVAPGVGLNVSVRVQDLGNLTHVNLTYAEPGGAFTNTTMKLVSGVASDGVYNATVPASGSNGTISFRVGATNAAGAVVEVPASTSAPFTVLREKIPTLTVGIRVAPASCGGIAVNGGPFAANGSELTLSAGYYVAHAQGCYPYAFSGWSTTGGVSVAGTNVTTALTVHSNGTVLASFQYVRPFDRVALAFQPSGCGQIALNGSIYGPGSPPVALLDDASYALSAIPCSGTSFGGWSASNPTNLSVLGPAVTVRGNGTLTATFYPSATSSPVTFSTHPTSCGGVRLGNAGYVSGEILYLPNGSYPVGPVPCAGWGFAGNRTTSGALSFSGGLLVVAGPGTVTYSYYKLTLVTIATNPTGCGGIVWDGVFEPDGSVLNVTNHTQHTVSAQPCNGTYFVSFFESGSVTLVGSVVVVDGPGTFGATFRTGTPIYFVGFQTQPGSCGAVDFNGVLYANSQFTTVAPGTIATVAPYACPGYGFVAWATSGGIAIVNSTAYVNQSGSISAIYHPLVLVAFFTEPANCGAILVDGVAYANNQTAELPGTATYSVGASACPYHSLAGWRTSAGANISATTLSLGGAATITALFVPTLYPVDLLVPSTGCGSVELGSTVYPNGSVLSLAAGAYRLLAQPCPGYLLNAWSTSGGESISGSAPATLTVSGAGSVTAEVGPAPIALQLAVPPSAASGSAVVMTATVAVPIAPYNYQYQWSFGDGSNSTAAVGTTSHIYTVPGTYLVRVSVTDPLGRTVIANASISIVTVAAAGAFELPPIGLAVLLGGVGAIVLGVAVSMVSRSRARRRGATSAEEPGQPDATSPPPRSPL